MTGVIWRWSTWTDHHAERKAKETFTVQHLDDEEGIWQE